jgi:hypothetical protein
MLSLSRGATTGSSLEARDVCVPDETVVGHERLRFAALFAGLVMRRVTTFSVIVIPCALALSGVVLWSVYVLGTDPTHFRGREFTDAGCHHVDVPKVDRVPVRHWPGLERGERAVAVQTVRTAFPTDVLVLTRNGRCVSQWALEGGP